MSQQPQNPEQPYAPPSAPSAPGSYAPPQPPAPAPDYQAQYSADAAPTQSYQQPGAYQQGDQTAAYSQTAQYQPSAPSAPAYDAVGQYQQPSAASAPAYDPNAAYAQAGQYQQGQYQPGYQGASPAAPARSGEGNFFSALFDLSFSKYITVTWAKVIYILSMIGVGLTWFFFAVLMGIVAGSDGWGAGFSMGGFLLTAIIGIIPAILDLVAIRLGLELVVAVVRTERNTRRSAEATEASAPSAPAV